MNRRIVGGITLLLGVWLTLQALVRFNQLENLTSGAPQQTVAALWAIHDLLLVVLLLLGGLVLMGMGKTELPPPEDEGSSNP